METQPTKKTILHKFLSFLKNTFVVLSVFMLLMFFYYELLSKEFRGRTIEPDIPYVITLSFLSTIIIAFIWSKIAKKFNL